MILIRVIPNLFMFPICQSFITWATNNVFKTKKLNNLLTFHLLNP